MRTSPVPLLLETLIDLFLELKILLKEPTPGLKENKELIFLDLEKQDELGNSRQVSRNVRKRNPVPKTWYDPSAFLFIDKLVSSLIRIKSGSPIGMDLISMAKEILELESVPVITSELVSPDQEKLTEKEKQIRKNANETWYKERKNQLKFRNRKGRVRRNRRSRKRSNSHKSE